MNDDVQNGCGAYESYADTYKDGGGIIFNENGTLTRGKLSVTDKLVEVWHVSESANPNTTYTGNRFDYEPADYDKCSLTFAEVRVCMLRHGSIHTTTMVHSCAPPCRVHQSHQMAWLRTLSPSPPRSCRSGLRLMVRRCLRVLHDDELDGPFLGLQGISSDIFIDF